MDIKYIIFKRPTGEFPIIFPAMVKHAMIAKSIQSEYPGIVPVRAAFAKLYRGYWHCYGESVSLKLKSNPTEDDILLNTFLK